MGIMISIGKWGGIYAYKGFGLRLCLGWVAITIFPRDGDQILELASYGVKYLEVFDVTKGGR